MAGANSRQPEPVLSLSATRLGHLENDRYPQRRSSRMLSVSQEDSASASIRVPSGPVAANAVQDFIDGRTATMQVSVSARHGSLQPGDQELVQEKAAKLRRLYDRVNAIEVTVDLKHTEKPTVEIQVSIEHADDCVATAESTTVIAALDTAIPKVEQQLRRIKEKKTGHRATGHKHIEPPTDDDQ